MLKKKKLKTRTKFVIVSAVNLTWYAVAVLIMSFYDKIVPDSLTTAWFSAWTIELALLFGIKVTDKGE